MTIGTTTPHARRYRPLLVFVVGLLMTLALGSGISRGAWDPPCKDAATPVKAAHAATPADRAAAEPRTGLDLEVRIWNVRIEFPWLKSLPLRPGRHIVVSIFEVTRS
jgi:hypothetical protein